MCISKEGMGQPDLPEFSVTFPSVARCPCMIFSHTTPAPSLLFNCCCTPLLRALHDDFYVSLLRETLKNLSPSTYQKFSLFLLMCIT